LKWFQVHSELDISTISKSLLDKKIIPSKLKFGFIGLGNIGSGIVKNLLNSGHDVIVWNRTPAKVSNIFKKFYTIYWIKISNLNYTNWYYLQSDSVWNMKFKVILFI